MENLSLLFHSFFLIILNLFSAAYSIPCLIFNSNICLESRQFYKKGHFLQKQYNVYADRYSHLDRERLPSSPYPATKKTPHQPTAGRIIGNLVLSANPDCDGILPAA